MENYNFTGHLSRRGFLALAGCAGLAVAVLPLTGCPKPTTASILADIVAWEPVFQTSFGVILALLGVPLSSLAVAAIQAGMTDVVLDIQAYEKAAPGSSLDKIDEVLSLFLGNLKDFFASQANTNPLIGLVVDFAQLILNTVAGFLSQLPSAIALPNSKKAMKADFRMGASPMQVIATPVTVLQYKETWNATAKLHKHPEYDLHIGVLEHLHIKR